MFKGKKTKSCDKPKVCPKRLTVRFDFVNSLGYSISDVLQSLEATFPDIKAFEVYENQGAF